MKIIQTILIVASFLFGHMIIAKFNGANASANLLSATIFLASASIALFFLRKALTGGSKTVLSRLICGLGFIISLLMYIFLPVASLGSSSTAGLFFLLPFGLLNFFITLPLYLISE